jgi:hypothetical protein
MLENLFLEVHEDTLEVKMKLLDRLLSLIGLNKNHFTGAIGQPSDLRNAILAIRSSTYYRITGKKLVEPNREFSESGDIKDRLAPSRRLARRSI